MVPKRFHYVISDEPGTTGLHSLVIQSNFSNRLFSFDWKVLIKLHRKYHHFRNHFNSRVPSACLHALRNSDANKNARNCRFLARSHHHTIPPWFLLLCRNQRSCAVRVWHPLYNRAADPRRHRQLVVVNCRT